jgi:putative transposase
MLLWYSNNLPGLGTSLVDVDDSSSTSNTSKRKNAGSMKQLGQKKRQKSQLTDGDVETPSSTK